jgi:hypothetical protein
MVGCTYPGHQFAQVSEFYTVVHLLLIIILTTSRSYQQLHMFINCT